MKIWTVKDRGFLPAVEPLNKIDRGTDGYWEDVEKLAAELPVLMENKNWRSEVVARLRPWKEYENFKYINIVGDDCVVLERAMLLYSYFASAFVHATYETKSSYLPEEISKPLVFLAKKAGRHPILSYASYCLYNWEKVDKEGEPVLGNIKLLQNFCDTNKNDEDWFILVHVDIEWQARHGVSAILDFDTVYEGQADEEDLKFKLEEIYKSLVGMNETLKRMGEGCDPDFYYNKVRPYIFGFENVVYSGCFDDKPQNYRGETGAQSSIVPLFIAALGVVHRDSVLTKHLEVMREYMPKEHSDILGKYDYYNKLKEIDSQYTKYYMNFRDAAIKLSSLKEIYNDCIHQLASFRAKHLEYAVSYIQEKVKNPQGTGGTPFIPWLSQLENETRGFKVN